MSRGVVCFPRDAARSAWRIDRAEVLAQIQLETAVNPGDRCSLVGAVRFLCSRCAIDINDAVFSCHHDPPDPDISASPDEPLDAKFAHSFRDVVRSCLMFELSRRRPREFASLSRGIDHHTTLDVWSHAGDLVAYVRKLVTGAYGFRERLYR